MNVISNRVTLLLALFCVTLSLPALSQSAAAPAQAQLPAAQQINIVQVQQTLAQIDQLAQQAALDLASLRIEKWKTDSTTKQQSQSNADSLRNNLSAALPGMVAGVRGAPTALAPAVKLYRDLNVLYDVLSGLAESAGAFGSKDDYRNLAADDQALDSARHSLADYLENLAAFKDSELARLRTQSANTANNTAVPKHVIDDTEPVKKPAKKKKASATPASKPTPKD